MATCSIVSKKILIACTGSVATIKLPLIIENILKLNSNIEIAVITTNKAKHFYKPNDIPPQVKIYCDEDEWTAWTNRGDPVLHIELTKWADLLLISPLDANTLAKIATGICDNLLTCAVRAWEQTKPLLFCPAMNTKMWEHPITSQQINTLTTWGYILIPCISKTLMCGDTGMGAMAEVSTINQFVYDQLQKMN